MCRAVPLIAVVIAAATAASAQSRSSSPTPRRHRRRRRHLAPVTQPRRPTAGTAARSRFQSRQRGDARRGCACAASSASASKASRTAASSTDATTSTALSRVPLQRDRHAEQVPRRSRPRCRTRASADKTVGPTDRAVPRPFDLRTAFADVGDAKAPVACAARAPGAGLRRAAAGRPPGWVNTGRTFDAARVILRRKPFQVDVFAASLVRILADEFDKSGNGNRFAGAYATHAEAAAARRPSSRTCSGGATSTCAASSARSARSSRRRSARARPASCRRGSTTASRWRCSAARSADDSVQRVGRPLAAARVACPAGRAASSRPNTTSPPATRIRPTACAARSISSIRPRTTSTAWPTRSAGGTSTTCASASRSRRFKATPITVQLPLLVAGRDARRALRGERRAAGARRRRRRQRARRPGDRRAGRRAPLTPQLQLAGGYAHICSRRVPQAGDARRVLQLPVRHGHLRVPGGEVDDEDNDDRRRTFLKRAPPARPPAALMAGLPAGWVGGVYADDSPGDDDDALRHHRAHRLLADRDGARAGLLQEVRHQVDRLEGSVVGGHPRQAVARREPGDAHADRHADRLDDGAGGLAGEADGRSRGCSTATARRSR